jgi:hypothetical protein
MRESQTSGGLVMRWVPVADARGRTHLEARWTQAPGPIAPVAPVAPVAPAHAA